MKTEDTIDSPQVVSQGCIVIIEVAVLSNFLSLNENPFRTRGALLLFIVGEQVSKAKKMKKMEDSREGRRAWNFERSDARRRREDLGRFEDSTGCACYALLMRYRGTCPCKLHIAEHLLLEEGLVSKSKSIF